MISGLLNEGRRGSEHHLCEYLLCLTPGVLGQQKADPLCHRWNLKATINKLSYQHGEITC